MGDPVDIQGLQSGPTLPDTTGSSWETQSAADRQAALDAHSQNIHLGLLAAGLSMLAAPRRDARGRRVPFSQALGQGVLAGLSTYESAEAARDKELLQQQQLRALQQYRQQEIGVRQQGVQEQEHRTNVIEAHDTAEEQIGGRRADIAGRQADIAQQRATIEGDKEGIAAGNLNLRGQELRLKYGPAGVDLFAKLRDPKSNVAKSGVYIPSPEEAAAMPLAEQRQLFNSTVNSYNRSQEKDTQIYHVVEGDGRIHERVVRKTTGETLSDRDIGQAPPKGTPLGDLSFLGVTNPVVPGATPAGAGATPPAVAVAPPTYAPPAPPAAPTGPLPTHPALTGLGKPPRDQWGKKGWVRGVHVQIDADGNVTPIGGPSGAAASGGL
jgi:hypothetical protein